jgi:FkbM family methyltransferase
MFIKMFYSPIILFTYNRPEHTQQVLDALALNKEAIESTLYIFCDGEKEKISTIELNKIEAVRKIAQTEFRFKEVIIKIQPNNKGLAQSILDGVTYVINKHGRAIVLEDDIKVEDGFLNYMNTALEFYKTKKEVFHINGFNNESNLQYLLPNYYFLNFMSCWGWATWKDRWDMLIKDHHYFYNKLINNPQLLSKYNYDNTLDFHEQLKANIDGKIKTWAILWFSTVFFNNGLCLTPKYSYVDNIGMDGSGIHCGESNFHKKIYSNKNKPFKSFINKVKLRELPLSRIHLKYFYKYGSNFSYKAKTKEIIKNYYIAFKEKIKKLIGYNQDFLIEQITCKKEWYGNQYGGFYVNPNIINNSSIVYSFGIGEDISFDNTIIEKHNAKVFGFDPTPKSIKWIESQNTSSNFTFFDFGIDIENGIKIFNLPENDEHVSGSIYNPNHVSDLKKVEVKMKTFKSIVESLKHKKIDVIKMDIEGSEYSVLEDILSSNIDIGQVLVEFHDRFFDDGKLKSKRIIKKLKQHNFLIFGISQSKEEISFINKKYLVD